MSCAQEDASPPARFGGGLDRVLDGSRILCAPVTNGTEIMDIENPRSALGGGCSPEAIGGQQCKNATNHGSSVDHFGGSAAKDTSHTFERREVPADPLTVRMTTNLPGLE